MSKQTHKGNIVSSVWQLAEPIATKIGVEIWDINFVKEGSSYYLRIFIDKESGITIDDCENMSRAIDKPLDELDPISQNYFLEVCSPGIERELKCDRHLEKSISKKVVVRLIRPFDNGVRQILGKLDSFDKTSISIITHENIITVIPRKNVAFIKLNDFEN